MLNQHVRCQLAIAFAKRLQQRCVVVVKAQHKVRFGEELRVQAHRDLPTPDGIEQLQEKLVPGSLDDRPVHSPVGPVPGLDPVLAMARLGTDDRSYVVQRRLGTRGSDQARGEPLDRFTGLVAVADLLFGHLAYDKSAPPCEPNYPLLLQAEQGFAHGGATDVDLVGDRLLDEAIPWADLARDDSAEQLVVDLIGQSGADTGDLLECVTGHGLVLSWFDGTWRLAVRKLQPTAVPCTVHEVRILDTVKRTRKNQQEDMCGIAGRILDRFGEVGADLVQLMQAQQHRGADSTGFALYGEPLEEAFVVKVFVEDRQVLDHTLEELRAVVSQHDGDFISDPTWDDTGQPHVFVRLVVSEPGSPIRHWVDAADGLPGVEIQSVGRSLEIFKDVGNATEVADKHNLRDFRGTHGLGHARLATESDIAPTASHPFWARPFPDVAIVHNGQLTNYFLWRRRLERMGYRFTTENDSEMIAVWISDQMNGGADLHAALESSVTGLDGVFTYLLSTADSIGMAKDRLAIKPITAVEEGSVVAMATEEQALRRLYPEEGEIVNYDGPRLVRVWPSPVPGSSS